MGEDQKLSGVFISKLTHTANAQRLLFELAAMQDLDSSLDSDLLNFDTLFASSNDEEVNNLWALTATSGICHDDDLLDVADLEPLSPMKDKTPIDQEQVQVQQEPLHNLGLTINTKLDNSSTKGRLAQFHNLKANGSPTSALPTRFALLSTTCVYEPGFTTSPRGKRRISQTHDTQIVDPQEDSEGEDGNGDEVADDENHEPFILSGADDYGLPVFTDAELSAMVESSLNTSSTSISCAALLSPRGLANEETSRSNPTFLDVANTLPISAEAGGTEHANSFVDNMLSTSYDNTQNFPEAQHRTIDLTGIANSSTAVPSYSIAAASPAMFAAEPVQSLNTTPVLPVSIAPNDAAGTPLDHFSPSGYAAAANEFLDSYSQHVQPFFLNPGAGLYQNQPTQTTTANAQFAMAMANPSVMDTMFKMNANYRVPADHGAGSVPPPTQVKAGATLKLRLPPSASAPVRGKGKRLAVTPDIADFKLVQIFHEFCDPMTKVLTPLRFQQLLLHHQITKDPASEFDSATDVSADVQKLFTVLDTKGVGLLDLERFMHSFQICNRCTEAKRRAHQALCASQGQAFTPTSLERQLMEDVAPVVVRVVPTSFEGHKVKSCDHYQWTWCEGFAKTGNEKCRGTNRHDKCPKYLANCTLWKHKLPPKSRKPRILLENVDSPTKKIKHFS
ncbi:unnamed protein product [Peronospora farinosa]|uniref:EF-hand domain-containing protein n=1 Tax=Peronospora farinosa TaxID=134698 RepID=A0AAV0TTS8_9STRA|nr:unnamed protein product [Peronospora farinosa]